jgi:hypothetical protein
MEVEVMKKIFIALLLGATLWTFDSQSTEMQIAYGNFGNNIQDFDPLDAPRYPEDEAKALELLEDMEHEELS